LATLKEFKDIVENPDLSPSNGLTAASGPDIENQKKTKKQLFNALVSLEKGVRQTAEMDMKQEAQNQGQTVSIAKNIKNFNDVFAPETGNSGPMPSSDKKEIRDTGAPKTFWTR
jgi:hypothetical protein